MTSEGICCVEGPQGVDLLETALEPSNLCASEDKFKNKIQNTPQKLLIQTLETPQQGNQQGLKKKQIIALKTKWRDWFFATRPLCQALQARNLAVKLFLRKALRAEQLTAKICLKQTLCVSSGSSRGRSSSRRSRSNRTRA